MVRVHFGPPLLICLLKNKRESQLSFEETKSKPSEAGSILRGKNSRWERSFREPHGNGVKEAGFDERGFSSAGRAPALQAGGQRFDPANLHQTDKSLEG